jgi:hypothetical protein
MSAQGQQLLPSRLFWQAKRFEESTQPAGRLKVESAQAAGYVHDFSF